jgi:hypothetical protein
MSRVSMTPISLSWSSVESCFAVEN